MLDDLRLAWRNVWRNTRRSVVTIAAAALALLVIIFYSGMVTGYVEGLQRNILDLEMGDGQIFAEEYRAKPSLYTAIEDPEPLLAKLRDAGYRVSPRLLAAGLGAGEDNSAGVQIVGLEVEAHRGVSKIHEQLHEGAWLSDDDDGVVIGRRLGEELGLGVGDELVVLSQGADGSMANEVYPVRGLLRGISEAVDRGGVFMTSAKFRELMVYEGGVHQIIFRIPEGVELDAAVDAAQAMAPAGVEVSSWKQLQPSMATMLESTQGAMAVMMGIIYIAVGIVVLNAMLMAVFERTREFGVLKAVGFGPGKVFRLIMFETAIQAAFAVTLGVLLAVPLNYYMTTTGIDLSSLGDMSVMNVAMDPIWRSKVDASTYTTPVTALVVIIILAVLYPASRAAWIKPLDAIRD
ncbi:ABC transporter permease [Pseudenhygromyxa sp. WMMC2535]|uniref:ABC transporter permease n=1 Tax=Pseudenhygromyxa sp. WMMC2535 TaxID=2712867 RepID=UPI0015525C6F|nr:FtsX-like permease family protein [Pseudenhygromyxa sp. WMMC2535]NVB38646.1 ABC transporter permease [Pseudenhygromyxa sp. WMMC2535]